MASFLSFVACSLVADDPTQWTTPTDTGNNPSTSPDLPPPIRTAPNEPCGDDFATKEPGAFRVWYVNANGISTKEGLADLHSAYEANPDVMQPSIREQYPAIFKEHFGQARVITATTCIPAQTTWKPGGVVLAILGPWGQHVSKVSRDDLGRWASATLTGSDGEIFTIFSVYNVVDIPLHAAGPSPSTLRGPNPKPTQAMRQGPPLVCRRLNSQQRKSDDHWRLQPDPRNRSQDDGLFVCLSQSLRCFIPFPRPGRPNTDLRPGFQTVGLLPRVVIPRKSDRRLWI
jgi:hypothetical protein